MFLKICLLVTIILTLISVGYLHRRNSLLRKKYQNITEYFGDVDSIMNSVRYGNLSVRAGEYSQKEMQKLTDSINRMIETLNDREKMITEYQSELTKKNNFLATILNALSDGMLVCDSKFVIVDTNKNFRDWINNEKPERTKLEDYVKIPDDKTFAELKDDEVFIKGKKDVFYKATTTVLDSKEHKAKYMIVISNCTDQREVESLKEDFVATLTHDLKVPVIAEANMLEFLLKGKFGQLSDEQIEALKTMSASNKELLELVQTVLDTYKVKEGEIELHLEQISVQKLLSEIAGEMESIAQKNNNKIVVNAKTDFEIKVDYLQFKRVIKNLVSNAIIYGKPETNIELTAKQKGDDKYIYVKDYGRGIAKEDIDKVFNKYYSAHKKFRKIGTGLGLYLSQKLVTAHGGTLDVASKEGEWTQFVVKLQG